MLVSTVKPVINDRENNDQPGHNDRIPGSRPFYYRDNDKPLI